MKPKRSGVDELRKGNRKWLIGGGCCVLAGVLSLVVFSSLGDGAPNMLGDAVAGFVGVGAAIGGSVLVYRALIIQTEELSEQRGLRESQVLIESRASAERSLQKALALGDGGTSGKVLVIFLRSFLRDLRGHRDFNWAHVHFSRVGSSRHVEVPGGGPTRTEAEMFERLSVLTSAAVTLRAMPKDVFVQDLRMRFSTLIDSELRMVLNGFDEWRSTHVGQLSVARALIKAGPGSVVGRDMLDDYEANLGVIGVLDSLQAVMECILWWPPRDLDRPDPVG